MATPTIKIDQVTLGSGSAGVARSDLVLAQLVTLTDPANGAGTYLWVLEDRPVGSAVTLADAATDTATFTPDVTGSYLFRCTFDGGATSTLIGAVVTVNRSFRIPAAGETLEFGIDGWHPAMDAILRDIDTNLSTGGATHVAAETITHTIRTGDVESHDSATPKVVSQFQLDPTDYDMANATRSLVFRAVAANGGGVASTNVRLYNLTDGETIATLNFTSASPTMKEATLTEGSGAGEVDLSAKVYEVRIFVDTPDAIDDTIELGSAEIRVINTVN